MELFDILFQVPYLPEILQILMAGHAVAIAIVNLTPTPKDDQIVGKVYRYIEFFAGIVSPKSKQVNDKTGK